MRTTKDLIQELRDKAEGAFVAGIVVGFEKKTEFVWANAPDPLGDLNALVERGGEPIAMCRMDKIEGAMNYSLRPLEEYINEGWVNGYLDALGTGVVKLLATQTGAKVGDIKRVRPDLN
jgi:hypothetical protein